MSWVGAVAASAQDDAPPMAMGQGGRMTRGTVTAVAPDHLTAKTEKGDVFQIAISGNTQVRKGRELMKVAEIRPGDGVGAMGELDASTKTIHALYVFVVDAEQIKKLKEDMGKTYIAGKVTAIDELKITVMRTDGVSQVIAVDEDTSFKKGGRQMQMMMSPGMGAGAGPRAGAGGQGDGGESITLADVKVGDTVGGQGSLKGGVFVPKQLMVGDPAAGGRRRQQQGEVPK